MSRWAVGAVALLAALGALVPTGSKSVHAERVMPYPPQAIWAVLMDADHYGDWNPVLVHAEGRFEEGRTMRYRMRTATGARHPSSPSSSASTTSARSTSSVGLRACSRSTTPGVSSRCPAAPG